MIKLIREWRQKRELNRLFKEYGKALYANRVHYVESFMTEEQPSGDFNPHRMRIRKVAVIIMIMVLLMALAIVGAKTLEEEPSTFTFKEYDGHSDVRVNLKGDPKDKEFFEVGYVPTGYEYLSSSSMHKDERTDVYINTDKHYLYVGQSLADTSFDQNNEKCEIHKEKIEGVKVIVYEYDNKSFSYMLVKEEIFVDIYGFISKHEMKEIIKNLK